MTDRTSCVEIIRSGEFIWLTTWGKKRIYFAAASLTCFSVSCASMSRLVLVSPRQSPATASFYLIDVENASQCAAHTMGVVESASLDSEA